MHELKKFGVVLGLLVSNVSMASSYNCTIKEYVSEQSQVTSDLVAPFAVELNLAGDPIPAGFRKAGNVSWSVTRYDGLISAEIRDSAGRSISISTTRDGQPLGVKAMSEKQILTCNPARAASTNSLQVNPMTYGESMTVNPQNYGSIIQRIERLDPKLREQFRRFLEEK